MKREMNVRAQVSVFIILAIVLVVAGGIAYYMARGGGNNNYFSQSDVKPGFDNVKNSVYECMKMVCSDSLDIIGIQGGYYTKPKESFDMGWAFIPYYYNQGIFLMPATSEIENQLGLYVDDNLNSCLESIVFNDFSLSYVKAKTKAIVSKGEVRFDISMPISVKKGEKATKFELKDNPVLIQSKLSEMIEVASYISDSHKEDPDMICISCIADMARERELYVDMLDFGQDSSTTLVVVSNNMTESYPAVFEFLNKYNARATNLPSAP